jgi:hypothetical protein
VSIPELRTVRVTKAPSAGRWFPEARPTTEAGLARHAKSNQTFPHREVLDRNGFVSRVIEGRDSDEKCAVPTSAPNRSDLGSPDARDRHGYLILKPEVHQETVTWVTDSKTGAKSKRYDGQNGVQTSARRVRTVADGDERLKGLDRDSLVRDGAKPAKVRKSRGVSGTRPAKSGAKVDPYADVREFAVAHGIPLEKIADKRVRAAIRELITHRAQVAAYAAK